MAKKQFDIENQIIAKGLSNLLCIKFSSGSLNVPVTCHLNTSFNLPPQSLLFRRCSDIQLVSLSVSSLKLNISEFDGLLRALKSFPEKTCVNSIYHYKFYPGAILAASEEGFGIVCVCLPFTA